MNTCTLVLRLLYHFVKHEAVMNSNVVKYNARIYPSSLNEGSNSLVYMRIQLSYLLFLIKQTRSSLQVYCISALYHAKPYRLHAPADVDNFR